MSGKCKHVCLETINYWWAQKCFWNIWKRWVQQIIIEDLAMKELKQNSCLGTLQIIKRAIQVEIYIFSFKLTTNPNLFSKVFTSNNHYYSNFDATFFWANNISLLHTESAKSAKSAKKIKEQTKILFSK